MGEALMFDFWGKFPPLCLCLGCSAAPVEANSQVSLEGSVEPGLLAQHNCSQLLWRRISLHHPWAEEAEIHLRHLVTPHTWHKPC